MDQTQPQREKNKPDAQNTLDRTTELFTKLERVIRASNKDSMEIGRDLREMRQTVESLHVRMDDLELQIKGLTQESWRAAKESQALSQTAKQHFAEALRDLEKRIRKDMQWEFNRATALAVFPAISDLDLVIEQQRLLNDNEHDSLLEAVEMVRSKFDQAFVRIGWRKIKIKIGETKFNPELHEGVDPGEGFPMDENKAALGTILQVQRHGYLHGDHVLRPAQVVVKK